MWFDSDHHYGEDKQGFADDRQVGDVVWRLFWLFAVAGCLASIFFGSPT